jgi:hypothetical protein
VGVKQDAAEFGQHVRLGGWRLGLLVARNVQKGKGQGARQPRNDRHEVEKVSATRFGQLAGTSAPRVLRYLAAWEAAADDGYVKHAADLTPGQEIDLDPGELPPWSKYYVTKKPKGPKGASHPKLVSYLWKIQAAAEQARCHVYTEPPELENWEFVRQQLQRADRLVGELRLLVER